MSEDQVGAAFERLYGIIRRLRAPGGCEWDRQQTAASLRSSLLEEAYECVDAIDRRDAENLCEELGDVYLVATMIAVIEEEGGGFSVSGVLARLCEKLIRRHPHVFADAKEHDVARILEQWDRIKREEKPHTAGVLEGVPLALPSLERAVELQKRASRVGFDWPDAEPVFEKLAEEIAEAKEARGDPQAVEMEIGDMLFTVANLARLLGVDPARALDAANRKFAERFRALERRLAEQGRRWSSVTLAEMDEIWEDIKKHE